MKATFKGTVVWLVDKSPVKKKKTIKKMFLRIPSIRRIRQQTRLVYCAIKYFLWIKAASVTRYYLS